MLKSAAVASLLPTFAVNIKWRIRIRIRIGGKRQRARNAVEWENGRVGDWGMGNAVEWRMQWNAVEWSTGNGEWGSGWNETIVMQMCPAITVHGRCTVEAQSKAKSPAEDKTRGMWGKSALPERGTGAGQLGFVAHNANRLKASANAQITLPHRLRCQLRCQL